MLRGNIKGSGVAPFLRYYGESEGPEALARGVRSLPEEHRRHFLADDPTVGVLASSWYPAEPIHALLDRLFADMSAARREEVVRGAARRTIDSTLKGVYRWLFTTMMSPERYARQAQELFSRYYDTGQMTKTPLGEDGHLSVVRDWPAHHAILCELLLYTGPYVYEALGCRDVVMTRTACVDEGHGDCRFEIRWSR